MVITRGSDPSRDTDGARATLFGGGDDSSDQDSAMRSLIYG